VVGSIADAGIRTSRFWNIFAQIVMEAAGADMRILIAAVGKLKAGPEQALFDGYVKRLSWPVILREVETKGRLAGAELRAREGELLLAALDRAARGGKPGRKAGQRLLALDERGPELASAAFATRLAAWRDQGAEEIAFVIGGADGLDQALRDQADGLIAFGRMTWPHMLARVLLAEQIYRAQQILAGHPYHRS
jgi:23S rRNA (pseudouridine1915-N3)-methyltransferase